MKHEETSNVQIDFLKLLEECVKENEKSGRPRKEDLVRVKNQVFTDDFSYLFKNEPDNKEN